MDADTLYQFNLQNNYNDEVTGNPAATLAGSDQSFVTDGGPFGSGDYAFDPASDTALGQGTKGAFFTADLGNDITYTIELFHFLPNARANVEFAHMVDFNNTGADINPFQNKSGGTFKYGIQGDAVLENIGTAPSDDAWHHFVIEFNPVANTMFWAFDGNRQSAEVALAARDSTGGVFGLGMGNSGMASDNSDWPGYVAYVRVSKVLRYDLNTNATYTVPTAPYE